MIDTHAHLTHKLFENTYRFLTYENDRFSIAEGGVKDIIEKLKDSGVTAYVEPAIDIESNYKALELRKDHEDFVYVAVGVHPNRVANTPWERRLELESLADRQGVVAIGETGLDYHYKRREQKRFCQKKWFIYQLDLAYKKRLPLVLHIRKVDRAAIRILNRHKDRIIGGVVHCFNDNEKIAKKYLKLGLYFGIGGIILQNNERGDTLRRALKIIPMDRILLETDAPFVMPDVSTESGDKFPKKVRNSSFTILAVAKEIASIKGLDVKTVQDITTQNAKTLFKI